MAKDLKMAKRTRQSMLYILLCVLFYNCNAAKEVPEPKKEKLIEKAIAKEPVADSFREEKGYEDITVQELMKKIEKGRSVLIDVRTPGEYAQGHIKGAILIPLADIETRHKEISKRFT